jgi:hypothetical protein
MKKWKNRRQLKCCYGISSQADRHYGHIMIMDYDHQKYNAVLTHLMHLQEEYELSNIYVIKSTHGYNAVCLDINPISLYYNMGMSVFSPCDREFMKYGFDRGYYTLRFDKDKALVDILEKDSRKYTKSLAHKIFLEWFFGIVIEHNERFNDAKTLTVIQYPSSKNGYHLVEKNLPPNYRTAKV